VVEPAVQPKLCLSERLVELVAICEDAHGEVVSPPAPSRGVLDRSMDDPIRDPRYPNPRCHVAELRLSLRGVPPERQPLDDDDVGMALTGLQEGATLVRRRCDQVARKQHRVEAPAQIEVLDPTADRLGTLNSGEHLAGLIHRSDAVTEPQQLPRDAPGAAPKLENRPTQGHGLGDKLALALLWQERVQRDRAPVRRNAHRPDSGSRHDRVMGLAGDEAFLDGKIGAAMWFEERDKLRPVANELVVPTC
jgi:hypothetical protein